MEEKLLKNGIKYIVKVGRNRIPVKLVQKNADGVSYLVKNLKILKPFFVRSEKSFVDFQNDIERQKALKIIEKENAQIAFPKDSKVPNEPEIAKISNSSKVHNNPKTPQVSKLSNEEDVTKISNDSKLTKTSKISNEGKFSKNPKIMGFRKCAFVRALGRLGYNYEQAKKKYWRTSVSKCLKSL